MNVSKCFLAAILTDYYYIYISDLLRVRLVIYEVKGVVLFKYYIKSLYKIDFRSDFSYVSQDPLWIQTMEPQFQFAIPCTLDILWSELDTS